jgi:hypothetical protein
MIANIHAPDPVTRQEGKYFDQPFVNARRGRPDVKPDRVRGRKDRDQ